MAARSFQIALGAGATRLSDVYLGLKDGVGNNIGGSAGVPDARSDVPYRQLVFNASGAAAFIGGSDMAGTSTTPVTSTTYGTKVDSASTIAQVIGAYDQGPLKLSDLWASGAGSTLHILATPY